MANPCVNSKAREIGNLTREVGTQVIVSLLSVGLIVELLVELCGLITSFIQLRRKFFSTKNPYASGPTYVFGTIAMERRWPSTGPW